jgi:Putative beta-barrel porin-2, OmpL-like. bbp2
LKTNDEQHWLRIAQDFFAFARSRYSCACSNFTGAFRHLDDRRNSFFPREIFRFLSNLLSGGIVAISGSLNHRSLQSLGAAALMVAMTAAAQAPATPPPAAPADQAPAAAPAAPTWSVGPMDLSGLIDGYYSYNYNRPSTLANGQANDLYNFNDKTDQFNLSEARLTLNHDPDPVGAHVDLFYGRTNTLINGSSHDQGDYIEQAFVSLKPPKAKGLELDFGKFVTSAGAEVIEAKDNWNYSRSILFAWAIPYFHFGLRTSMPVSKVDTLGVQIVNGWNNVTSNNGGVTIGLTNALVKPKASWFVNYYTGPSNANTQKGYRNLIDTTLLMTPSSKFSAYVNYDYGQNRNNFDTGEGIDKSLNHWQGVAFAAKAQMTGTQALTGRYDYFKDYNGYSTGTAQNLQEFTGTYEYKMAEGFLTRVELRKDWSDQEFFHKGDGGFVKGQFTATAGFIAFFGPKR